jgi:hypothetical protein
VSEPPEGWTEVFSGACLEANLLHAVLEANDLKPVVQQFSPQVWWSGGVSEDCRVYVPSTEVERAREILADHAQNT